MLVKFNFLEWKIHFNFLKLLDRIISIKLMDQLIYQIYLLYTINCRIEIFLFSFFILIQTIDKLSISLRKIKMREYKIKKIGRMVKFYILSHILFSEFSHCHFEHMTFPALSSYINSTPIQLGKSNTGLTIRRIFLLDNLLSNNLITQLNQSFHINIIQYNLKQLIKQFLL